MNFQENNAIHSGHFLFDNVIFKKVLILMTHNELGTLSITFCPTPHFTRYTCLSLVKQIHLILFMNNQRHAVNLGM